MTPSTLDAAALAHRLDLALRRGKLIIISGQTELDGLPQQQQQQQQQQCTNTCVTGRTV